MQISMFFTCNTKMSRRSRKITATACTLMGLCILCVNGVFAESVTVSPSETVEVNKCPAAYRYKNFQTKEISIPEHLVSNGEPMNFRFGLRYQGCYDGETILYPLSFNRIFNADLTSKLNASLPDQFMPDGKLRFQSRYYYKEDFCISNINESYIFIEICKRSCTTKRKPCISKCCDLNEVVEYTDRAFKCSLSENVQWEPFLYETPHFRLINQETQFVDKVKPQFEKVILRKNWFEKWPARDLTHISKTWPRKLWKVLSSGEVVFLDKSRQWLPFPPGQMCIDGLQNVLNEGPYNGEERNQIIFFIPDSLPQYNNRLNFISQLYVILSYSSSVLYFVIVFGYVILARNQNVHGWTILSYMLSLFFMSVLIGTVHYFTYAPSAKIQLESTEAATLAIFAHYFVISSYCWISVMSFDLLLTFNSVTPSSTRSKGVKRFLSYSALGWGLPLIIVSFSVLMDYLYSDIESERITPDYGKYNFFIAPWAQGIYLYYIIAVVLVLNLMFAAMTVAAICKFRRSTNLLSKGDISTKNRDFLSFKLYSKLFIVMGILWTFELISWLHARSENPWYWVVVDVIASLQSIALFLIFLCNRTAFDQLKGHFEGLGRSVRGSVHKLSSFRRSSSQDTDITRISM